MSIPLRLAVLAFAASAAAQQFVAQIDPSPTVVVGSNARYPVAGPGHVWFSASDSGFLCRTDGTLAGTQQVLNVSWGLIPLVEVGGRLLFVASNTAGTLTALFATDGTPGGTVQLLPSTAETKVLGVINNRVVFTDKDGYVTRRIWTTDMTPGGTTQLGVLATSPAPSAAVVGNELIILAKDIWTGMSLLFATDGVTFSYYYNFPIAIDFWETNDKGTPMATLGAHAYFVARRHPADELWRTDGTSAGTGLVTGIGPARASREIIALGSQLLIQGDYVSTQILQSDGTAAGTTVMTTRTFASGLRVMGNLAFFFGADAQNGGELWRTDGTDAGTFTVLDATPGPGSSQVTDLTPGLTRLYCFDRSQGRLLWSDGTVAGSSVLPMQLQASQQYWAMATVGDTAILTVPPPQSGLSEAIATDGTLAGTVQLTSNAIRPGMVGPYEAHALGNTLYFLSDTTATGRELWRSDGTAAGTSLVEDLAPGPADGVIDLAALHDRLYFISGSQLWRSDGTAGGRTLMFTAAPALPQLHDLRADGDYLLMRMPTDVPYQLQAQLVRSDGTTTTVIPAALQFHDAITALQVDDDTYYVGGPPGPFPQIGNLYRWNGGPGLGTDLGRADAVLGRLGDQVVFARQALREIAITDGTVSGTRTIGQLSTQASTSVAFGATVVMADMSGGVHATDGTTLTTLPATITFPQDLIAGKDAAFFHSLHPTLGRVLYRTDGTVAGTQVVADLGVLAPSGVYGVAAIGAGTRMFLRGRDDTTGLEPWISDGTTLGTTRLADIHPGGNSSDAELLGVAGTRAFFAADDGVTGKELWTLELGSIGAASLQSIGVGCAGGGGIPRLRAEHAPEVGMPITLTMDRCAPNSLALWFIGYGMTNIPIGSGCTFYVETVDRSLWNITDANGTAQLPLFIPLAPEFLGFPVMSQAGVLEPLGTSVFGTSATPGLLWVVGG